MLTKVFPSGSDSKESVSNDRDPGSVPRSGRSPGEGNDYPLQYSCLENPMDASSSLKISRCIILKNFVFIICTRLKQKLNGTRCE